MTRVFVLALLLLAAVAGWAQPNPEDVEYDVTHAVTDYHGNPVPNARVFATYCRKDAIIYRTATADARGNVSWNALPGVRVIVWGDGVPAKLLDPQINVLQPLPPSKNHPTVRFEVPVPGGTYPTTFQFWMENRGSQSQYSSMGTRNGKTVQVVSMQVDCATRCSILAVIPGNPASVAFLDNVYIPYVDEVNAQLYFAVPIQRLAPVDCRFLLNGKPTTVSRLEVWPVSIQHPWPDSPTFEEAIARLMKPQRTPDGYRFYVPGPGRYRLLTDLYDETTQPFPGSVIDVPEEGKTVEISLPALLFSVPAGAEVHWTTRNAALKAKQLIAAADSKPMPIFGPRDGIYTAWFRATPDTLQVYHGDTGTCSAHALLHSAITIEANGGRTGMFNSMRPLLFFEAKLTRNIFDQDVYDAVSLLNSHLIGKKLEFGRNDFPFIWSGKYLLMYGSQYQVVELTEGKGGAVTWAKEDTPGGLRKGLRFVMIETPEELPPAAAGIQNPSALVFVDDARKPYGTVNIREGGGGTNIAIPANAKTLTFYAPGIGVIRNVPAPPATDRDPRMLLQGWEPWTTVAGKLQDENGQPLANINLRLMSEFEYAGIPESKTDAQGKFRFANLCPGNYFVVGLMPKPAPTRPLERDGMLSYQERTDACWSLQVPEGGLPNAVLSLKDGIRINTGGNGREGLWWFPAHGAPMRLSAIDQANYCGLTLGEGMLWFKEGFTYRESSTLRRYVLQPTPDMLAINDGREGRFGSYLSLYRPLKDENYYPGDITIIGLEERTGFDTLFSSYRYWQPSPELGFTAAQLGPFPTGKYRVIIGDGTGEIQKEVVITEYGANVTLP